MSTDDPKHDEPGQFQQLHQWERRLLVAAFGGWAVILAAYGQASINRIDLLSNDLKRDREIQSDYRMLMERRVTVLEEQNRYLVRVLDKMNPLNAP